MYLQICSNCGTRNKHENNAATPLLSGRDHSDGASHLIRPQKVVISGAVVYGEHTTSSVGVVGLSSF